MLTHVLFMEGSAPAEALSPPIIFLEINMADAFEFLLKFVDSFCLELLYELCELFDISEKYLIIFHVMKILHIVPHVSCDILLRVVERFDPQILRKGR